MTGITEQLADFAAGLNPAKLPEEVSARAALLIFDLTGIMVRARHDAESTPSLTIPMPRLHCIPRHRFCLRPLRLRK